MAEVRTGQASRLNILREPDDGQQVRTEVCDEMTQHDDAKMENGEPFYVCQDIVGHEGPLTAQSLNWKGSTWDVWVHW